MHVVLATAFFCKNRHDALSGMPRYIYKMADFLMKRGHVVEVVAGASNNKRWKYHGVLICNAEWNGNMDGSAVSVSIRILRREYAIQRKIHEIDQNDKIDIVQYAGWSGTGCMHSLKCPSVLRLSTYSKVQYQQNELFMSNIKIYSFWERVAGRRADGVIAPGEILGRQFGADISKKVTVIETPYVNDVNENPTFYEDRLKGYKYMFFYGTASRDKGFEAIGDMLVKFFENNEDMYFVFAGWDVQTNSGSAVQNMKKKLGRHGNRMLYLGVIQQEQLYPVIRGAEFVLIPSLIDNLPNTCLEALSLNKIVIGTFHTSLEQMIEDGKNGFLSEPGNSESLLEAVQCAYSLSEGQKERMVLNNRRILKKYSPEIAVRKLENYYKWIIESKN